MKSIRVLLTRPLVRVLALVLASLAVSSYIARAHPYASSVAGTNAAGNGPGIASFILNESADDVSIIYDPGQPSSWTNDLGQITIAPGGGLQQFLFPGTNTSFQIIVNKKGNGQPSLISSDTFSNSIWGTPRGIAVAKNPSIGTNFGRVYVGHAAVSGAFGGVNTKYHGLYCLNADQT